MEKVNSKSQYKQNENKRTNERIIDRSIQK